MTTFSTKDLYGEYVIKGKLLKANYEVSRNGIVVYAADLDLRDAPYQLNNMLAWLQAVSKDYGDGELSRNMGAALRQGRGLSFELNDGRGRLKGRESSSNVMKIWLDDLLSNPDKAEREKWMILMRINTVSHASIYQKEVRQGLRTPKSQSPLEVRRKELEERGEPYFNELGEICLVENTGMMKGIVFAWPKAKHEEFYALHPEWEGKVHSLFALGG